MLDAAKLKPIYKIINIVRGVLIVLLFSFIISVGAINIFLRYMPGLSSLKWPDEILRYVNIWVIFLGASVGVRLGAHLSIDYFIQKLFARKTYNLIRKGTLLIILGCLIFLIILGIDKFFKMTNVFIQAAPMSISVFYMAIPIGCLLMFIDYLLIFLFGNHPYENIDREGIRE